MINKYAEINDRVLLYNACKGILRVKAAEGMPDGAISSMNPAHTPSLNVQMQTPQQQQPIQGQQQQAPQGIDPNQWQQFQRWQQMMQQFQQQQQQYNSPEAKQQRLREMAMM